MKRVNVEIPDTDTFMLAFPAPLKDLITISEKQSGFIVGPEGQEIAVRRIDYLKYPINQMSNFICQLAYGQDPEWVKEHLMKKYNYLTEESKICFFLFKIIEKEGA